MCLPLSYTWTRKGRAHQHRVRTRWGRQGRINLIGTLSFEGEDEERLEYQLLEGACRTAEVLGYLGALAQEAGQRGGRRPVVVVLDNASFHTAAAVREREPGWKESGLVLYRLPAYCPHLNPIEGMWRKIKGFLMPRRFYDSLAELKRAVLNALNLLGAVEIQPQIGDT